MTTATTRTREMTIAQLVNSGYMKAGLLGPYQTLAEPQVTAGVNELELILKGLSARGILARQVQWESVTIRNGIWQYTLSESTFDVFATAMYRAPTDTETQMNAPDVVATAASAETPVQEKSREEFQRISAKSASSRPVMYWAQRTGAQVIVYFWPVPGVSEDTGTVRFQAHQWRADATDPNTTADVERFWEDYLTWELGHRLAVASNMKLDRVSYLGSMAESKFLEAKAMSYQRADTRVVIGHRTPWSGR